MTRSDNPFGDLPEWKERQRLQEVQARGGGQMGGYAAPQQQYAQGYAAQNGFSDAAGGAGDLSVQHAPSPAGYYPEENAPAASQPQYYDNGAVDGPALQQPAPASHHQPQHAMPMPSYDAPPQGGYRSDIATPMGGNSPELGQPAGYGGAPDAGLREGYYDENSQYRGVEANPSPGAAPAYDRSGYAPGTPQSQFDHAPGYNTGGYYDPQARVEPQWSGDGAMNPAGAPAPSQVGYDDFEEDDEADYYDDGDDAPRYSWKMLAAVVVTGAVVTGGGVVLYDSLMSGGLGKNGEPPIVRAEQGPAKTAPADTGGRKFANRDSKLLGRLDSSGNEATTRNLGASEGGNRVRAVPTVKIGRDGRMILPKAPVNAPPTTADAAPPPVNSAGPGINIVDSLGGSRLGGLGGLPPIRPSSQAPAQDAQPRPAADQPAQTTANVRTINVQPASPAPSKQTAGGNRAIQPQSGPPPVPSKSSLGSAWRMTGAEAAAQKKPNIGGGIRPTIAQPVQLQPQPRERRTAPTQTASTLGAGSVANSSQGSRQYVAVLATAPTRMKALQSFAELQQKHPNALIDRELDVQRADLSARGLGIMYRVVVGPAGPRSSANSVCRTLKSEGYKGCWVKSN